MSQMVTVALRQKPSPDQLDNAAISLVQTLGVKLKTASQIINNIPLRVYNKLTLGEGRILVEALNITTKLQWEILTEAEADIPSVSWNKRPTVNGLSLEELMSKNDPSITGVGRLIPALQFEKRELPNLSLTEERKDSPIAETIPTIEEKTESIADVGAESTILKTADSIVRHLSADLEEAFRKKTMSSDASESLSSPAFSADSQNIPGTIHSRLEPGFYNLYLPAIRNNDVRAKVIKMCQDSLNWSSEDIEQNMNKPIICLARNIDDIDATRLLDRFAQIDVALNCKLRSKL